MKWIVLLLLLVVTGSTAGARVTPIDWIQPSSAADAQPVWGIGGGLSVGLWPTEGPRGLIRIYTPYLKQQQMRIMQFIAIEPIVGGHRDLSEMQKSRVDGKPGKPMWTADQADPAHPPLPTTRPTRGVISNVGNVQTLSFYVIVEPFDNGARPIIKISLRNDRPHEVQLQTFAAADSAPMQSCVLTATMGNWARLRELNLKDRRVPAGDLFQNDPQDSWQFFPRHSWSASELPIEDGMVTFSATGMVDQATPDDVPKFWRYEGLPARQYWRAEICPQLRASVNGRTTFWGTRTKIPGGPACENFELDSRYSPGQSFYFGVEPAEPGKSTKDFPHQARDASNH